MDYIILSLLGGIILFAILAFLPLKIPLKIKFVYVIISILYSNLFLFGLSFFQLWQLSVIVLLLIFLTSYFLMKTDIHTPIKKRERRVGEKTAYISKTIQQEAPLSPIQKMKGSSVGLVETSEATLQVASEVDTNLESLIKEQLAIQENVDVNNAIAAQQQEDQVGEVEHADRYLKLEKRKESFCLPDEIHEDKASDFDFINTDVPDSKMAVVHESEEIQFDFLESRKNIFAELDKEMFDEVEQGSNGLETPIELLENDFSHGSRDMTLEEIDQTNPLEKTTSSDDINQLTDIDIIEEITDSSFPNEDVKIKDELKPLEDLNEINSSTENTTHLDILDFELDPANVDNDRLTLLEEIIDQTKQTPIDELNELQKFDRPVDQEILLPKHRFIDDLEIIQEPDSKKESRERKEKLIVSEQTNDNDSTISQRQRAGLRGSDN